MKTLRTVGILVAVALVALGVALLPSADEMPQARPGIAVGEPAPSAAGRDAGAEPSGGAVALPSVTEQPARGVHTDTGVGAMEPEASPEPPPTKETPAQPPRSSGGSSDSSGERSSGRGENTSPRPSGVCEWDDGELECDDDDDDDYDDYDDDDDDDDDDD